MKAWRKNQGGKKDLPNPVKTPAAAKKRFKRRTPEQD